MWISQPRDIIGRTGILWACTEKCTTWGGVSRSLAHYLHGSALSNTDRLNPSRLRTRKRCSKPFVLFCFRPAPSPPACYQVGNKTFRHPLITQQLRGLLLVTPDEPHKTKRILGQTSEAENFGCNRIRVVPQSQKVNSEPSEDRRVLLVFSEPYFQVTTVPLVWAVIPICG